MDAHESNPGAGPMPARFPALRSRPFRTFWIGEFISRAGSHMQNTALTWHIYQLTHDPVHLGTLGLVRFIPIVCLSLLGGAVADRVSRRRLMFVTQSILMVSAAVLGWLTMQHRITVGAIYAIAAVNSVTLAFDNPARQSLVPNLVPRPHLANALSLSSTLGQVATIVGPAGAGVLLGAGGLALTYWINSLSFVALLVALLTIREPKTRPDASSVSLGGLREGLQFVLQTPVMLGMMALDAVGTFFSSANVLLPMVAQDVLHVDERHYGLLAASPAIGSLAVAAILSYLPTIRRQGRTVLIAVALHGLATVCFGLSPWYAVSCLSLAATGAADTLSTILRQTVRQLLTPDRLRGRVGAVNMVFFMGGPRLGDMEAGLVAKWYSAPISVVTGGIGCILTTLVVAWAAPAVRAYVHKERPLEVAK